MTSDYKKYSLEKLQEWVHDAMNSDASPHEIYSTIREAVREDYYYHKDCISRASKLLELLSGHRPVKDKELFEAAIAEKKYYEGYDDFECPVPEQPTGSTISSLEYTKAKIEANSAWNDGWTQQYYQKIVDEYEANQNKKSGPIDEEKGKTLSYSEAIAAGWTMTDDGFWIPPEKKKTWVLPVEELRDEDTGKDEYCITFPDDLLEAANLKENDIIEWVDQGDGSYLLKKHVERFRM